MVVASVTVMHVAATCALLGVLFVDVLSPGVDLRRTYVTPRSPQGAVYSVTKGTMVLRCYCTM